MPPFRVEYFCIREGAIWRPFRWFPSFDAAQMVCDGLVWQYHSARVLDANGNLMYQI